VPLLKRPSDAFIVVPVPFVPAPSMKNSAAATLLVASVSVAVTVGAEFAGVEDGPRQFERVGRGHEDEREQGREHPCSSDV